MNSKFMRLSNDHLTNSVIGYLVIALIDDGYRVELSNDDGGGLHLYAAANGKEIPPAGHVKSWVRLIPENSPAGCVHDYTTDLEEIMKPVLAFASALDDEG